MYYFVLFSTNVSNICGLKKLSLDCIPQLICTHKPNRYFRMFHFITKLFLLDTRPRCETAISLFRTLTLTLVFSKYNWHGGISIHISRATNKHMKRSGSIQMRRCSHPSHNSDEKIFLKASNLTDWTISSSPLTLSPWRVISSRRALLSLALINWMAFFLVFRMDIPR